MASKLCRREGEIELTAEDATQPKWTNNCPKEVVRTVGVRAEEKEVQVRLKELRQLLVLFRVLP